MIKASFQKSFPPLQLGTKGQIHHFWEETREITISSIDTAIQIPQNGVFVLISIVFYYYLFINS